MEKQTGGKTICLSLSLSHGSLVHRQQSGLTGVP